MPLPVYKSPHVEAIENAGTKKAKGNESPTGKITSGPYVNPPPDIICINLDMETIYQNLYINGKLENPHQFISFETFQQLSVECKNIITSRLGSSPEKIDSPKAWQRAIADFQLGHADKMLGSGDTRTRFAVADGLLGKKTFIALFADIYNQKNNQQEVQLAPVKELLTTNQKIDLEKGFDKPANDKDYFDEVSLHLINRGILQMFPAFNQIEAKDTSYTIIADYLRWYFNQFMDQTDPGSLTIKDIINILPKNDRIFTQIDKEHYFGINAKSLQYSDSYSQIKDIKSKHGDTIKKHLKLINTNPLLNENLIASVILAESNGKPTIVSPKGAKGLMQLMPNTATDCINQLLKEKWINNPEINELKQKLEQAKSDPSKIFDPEINLLLGIYYLNQQTTTFKNVDVALAAYNAGPAAVNKFRNTIPPYAETKKYVQQIHNNYESLNAVKEIQLANLDLTWPVQNSTVSSPYGYRKHPINGNPHFHPAVDIPAAQGATVHASMAGRITKAEKSSTYGNFVEIKHDNGVISQYSHLNTIDVKVGDKVLAKHTIATIGSTGNSTGPHLDYRISRNGIYLDPQAVHSKTLA